LVASGVASASLRLLERFPMLFPFELAKPDTRDLERSGRLEWFRQGLDQDMVTLRDRRLTG
jgi:hypothetical protein